MYAIICIFDFTNFMSFIIKFIKFKPIIKFKKFELHNYGGTTVCHMFCRMTKMAAWENCLQDGGNTKQTKRKQKQRRKCIKFTV